MTQSQIRFLLIVSILCAPLSLVAQQSEPNSAIESTTVPQEDEQDKDDEQEETDEEAEADEEKDDDRKGGQADLDKAFESKINAKSTRDLDKVADLCESAVEKGLEKASQRMARDLWASVLYDHAKQLQRRIAPGGKLSTRWRWLRREAISRLEKAIEVNPKKTDAMILLAQLDSLNAGDHDAAMEAIESAIAQIKDDNEKLSQALYIRSRLAKDDKARMADLSQAVKINPENFEALLQRAEILFSKEKNDAALEDYRAILKIDEENIDRYLLIGSDLRTRAMFDEAVEILEDAVEIEPDNVQLLVLRSHCLIGAEKDDTALKDLNKAIDLDRQNLVARELRARILISKEKYKDAMEDANELIQQKPDESVGLELRSLVHQASGELDKAISDTETLLERNPDNLNFKFNLAILHSASNRPSKAIPIFDVILRNVVETAQPSILRNRGDAYLSIGKHERAIDDYEMALDVFDELQASSSESEMSERQKDIKAGLLNNLAWVLATSTEDDLRDGERSVELATEASELSDYKKAYILSTLASGYAEEGDFDKAKKWAKKAVELAESDEQRKGLQDELDSYKRKEAWREIENVEEDKKKEEAKEKEDSDEGKGESSDQEDSDKEGDDDKEEDEDDDKEEDDDDSPVSSLVF